MPAEPGPGLIEIVIRHEHLRPVRVYDPAGGGKVRRGVFARKKVREDGHVGKHLPPVGLLLLVIGRKRFDLRA